MFFFQNRKLNERSKEIFERVKSIQKEIEEREKKNTLRKGNLNYLFKTKIFA